MQFLQGKDAINRIVDGGGVPSHDKISFTVDELESFYSLNILELWEFMYDLDWCLTSPIGIDAGIAYKKPFNEVTEFILRKCYGFDRRIIENSDLAEFAVKKHIQKMNKIHYSENSESCDADNSAAHNTISQLICMDYSQFIDVINGDDGSRYIDLFKRMCSENAIVAEHKMESLSEREIVPPQYSLKKYNKELKSELAEVRQRMEEMERQFADMPTPNNGQGKDEGAWEYSVTAACKAIAHVLEEGRRDWVSGQEKGTGDTDSAGKETFRALLNRMHPQGGRCRVKAEAAAWKVISDIGYTHTGGRKPNP